MTADEKYMHYAITLAEKGVGAVNPNPLVGAVVVKNGKIISEGYHKKYGEVHAERNALTYAKEEAKEDLKDASLYVTLEPCSHHGKTPPCTDIIIESGIKKVFIGCIDPNPLVAGQGVQILKDNGVEVHIGALENECKKQNEVFFHYIKNKTPFVIMKYAMTIDGKIATACGMSKWITEEKARERVHEDRNRYSAIMIGVKTVIEDNPMLSCRIANGRNPTRIICDTNLSAPINSNILKTAKDIRTIIATSTEDEAKLKVYLNLGAEIINTPKKDGYVDLSYLMKKLGSMNIDSVILEGGSMLNFSALKSGIVNKIQTYIAPKIFGGVNAKTPVGGAGFLDIDDCVKLKNTSVEYIGNDILIESEVYSLCSQE